ncbi:hypothetical protein [Listeria booriae]|uniref:Hydrophobic protein n=1 Tax=Listeria booriae TaxID=1552123 RepID=A0A841ZW17_9LIST|nr:hypothetical protein [Listeria booriae]MBC1563883.1 hypothetical protein [Listeria booriae]
MPIFITVIILIYFITKQFEYEKVNRLTYVAIPIYSIYQITVTLPHRSTNIPVWIIILVFVIGACIGIYQASKVQIKDAKVTTGYTEVAGVEQVVYKKQIMVKGGARYLIGWAAIILAKFLLAFLLHLDVHESMMEAFVQDALKDMVFFLSFAAKEGPTAWMDWTLIGISSAVYTLRLIQKSPLVKTELLHHKHKK